MMIEIKDKHIILIISSNNHTMVAVVRHVG
jgi:hypothetical protein